MAPWQNKWIYCSILRTFVQVPSTASIPAQSAAFLRNAMLVFLLVSTAAYAEDNTQSNVNGAAFEFGHQDLQSLQFSRQKEVDRPGSEIQTELSFKLSPGKFDFSSAGAFGLSGVFSNPELEIISRPSGKYRVQESFPDLHNGLSYSAGIKIEHEDKDLADTAYVSSGQLGLSYGRLGQVWYSGVDLSIGQFSSLSPEQSSGEILSLDFTTGRKVGLTGVGPHAPLWLFSLQGNFDIQTGSGDREVEESADWYLNPSLFWRNPDFTFAAQLQVPVDSDVLKDFEEPDYRLRALFEKHFR
ncbi:MAG: hypothetical protein KTR33_11380 [Gammaproteobacteria bacterium]|nr:hypothetical protein [Gammaproteobacteria bacterium]